MHTDHGSLRHAGGGRSGSNVNFIRQVPKFLQGHMHFLGAKGDEDIQEQLTAKREMPQWDSEEDEAAEKEVSVCAHCCEAGKGESTLLQSMVPPVGLQAGSPHV